jgi:arylsulfatase
MVRPPKGAPNVLLILLDDAGFGQFSAFGGGVPSPNIEKLAAQGLRYTRFHTTACARRRAPSLLTVATIMWRERRHYGARDRLRWLHHYHSEERRNGFRDPQAEWLRQRLDRTRITNTAALGDRAKSVRSIAGRLIGIDYLYGFNSGDTSPVRAVLIENRQPRVPALGRSEYSSHFQRNLAIMRSPGMQRTKAIDPARPFLPLCRPRAPRIPRTWRPRNGWINTRVKFDSGWDRYREMTFERQKKLGVVPQTPN